MDILNSIRKIEEVHNEPNFMVFVESHLQYFQKQAPTTALAVSEQQNGKYEGDFYGLLGELRVIPEHRYIVMRVNGLTSSADFKGDRSMIIIPDLAMFNTLKQVYKSKKKF